MGTIIDPFLGSCQQIKKIELNDGRVLFCAWISRDPEEEAEGGRSTSSFALAASFNSTEFSVASIAEVSGRPASLKGGNSPLVILKSSA